MTQKKGTVWHQTDSLHYRVLKRSFVEFEDEGIKWEISTVLLEKYDPANLDEVAAALRDMIDDVKWLYETMIFKLEEDLTRVTSTEGASSYGYYRSDDSADIVKAHDQIVSLIAERKLTPVKDTEHNLQISPHIVKAMTEKIQLKEYRKYEKNGRCTICGDNAECIKAPSCMDCSDYTAIILEGKKRPSTSSGSDPDS